MLTIIVILAVLTALIATVVHLEVNYRDAPITQALRAWQSGLGALVGLVGVAVSVSTQTREADMLERAKLQREGLVVALTMQVEAFDIRRWLKRVDSTMEDYIGDWKQSEESDKKTSRVTACQLFFLNARHRSNEYVSLKIIEGQIPHIGKVNVPLNIHFLDLLTMQKNLSRTIAEVTDEECKRNPGLRLDFVKEDIANLRTALDRIEKAMSSLPETRRVTISY